MDQYLVKLEVFYDQKMKYLTKKDKFIKCQKCEGEKNFKESKDEIILSCGSDKGDQCGPQIIIKLPKYMHYENKINKLKEGLNDEYNWEILQKFFNVSEEAKKSEERQEKINEEIRRIEQLYFEKNMALKQEQIQIFYDQRIRKTKECNEIIKKLNEEGEEQKADLRKKYITLVQEINNEYEQIQELMKDINPFLIDQEPEVIILHENYEYKKVKKEKKKKEKKEKKEGVVEKEDDEENDTKFKEGMKVSWMYKETKKMGVIKELKEKGALVVDDKGRERPKPFNKLTIEDN